MSISNSGPARAAVTAPTKAAAPIERPTPSGANAPGFGSDVVAETLRALDIS